VSKKTAVAAPAQPPFEDLLAVIDRMTLPELVAFTKRLLQRIRR